MSYLPEIWRFRTVNFTVVFEALPEDMAPEDSFEFPEDIEAVRSGAVEWFCASVRVLGPGGDELGADYLGGCAYRTFEEFCTGHRDPDPMNRNSSIMRAARGGNVSIGHYFPGMVAQAIAIARRTFADKCAAYCSLRLRAT